jgi:hypothetical protein
LDYGYCVSILCGSCACYSSAPFFFLIDGTWVSASQAPGKNERQSNIFELNRCIDKQNKKTESQITFYVPGVGSETRGSWFSEQLLGGGFAHGLDIMVEQAYIDLVSNFRKRNGADKIYIFGFSRGAVVARILADMISLFGVLKQDYIHMYKILWEHCSGENRQKKENVAAIRDYCEYPVEIEFLGVFDTVPGITGILDKKFKRHIRTITFDDRTVPISVKATLHILAMNESRIEFMLIPFAGVLDPAKQSLEQIWMPGSHSDVGGVYDTSPETAFLGNVSLLTMIRRLQEKVPDLGIDEDRITGLENAVEKCLKSKEYCMNSELGLNWPISSALAVSHDTFPKWRLLQLLPWQRKRCCEDKAFQVYHPLCTVMNNKFINTSGKQWMFNMEKFFDKGWPHLNVASADLLKASRSSASEMAPSG